MEKDRGKDIGNDPADDTAAREHEFRTDGAALNSSADEQDRPPELRGKSLLHREVKAVPAHATSVLLPSWRAVREGGLVTDPGNTSRARLTGARLEQKLTRITPEMEHPAFDEVVTASIEKARLSSEFQHFFNKCAHLNQT